MSKQAQHTPGPWIARTVGDNTTSGMQIRGAHEWIATCHWGAKDTAELDAARANASLIAAAPELYEAAQDALDWIADSIQRNAPGVEQDDPPVAQLRAALAKARGDA